MSNKKRNKVGRPKASDEKAVVVDEKAKTPLMMDSDRDNPNDLITIEKFNKRWKASMEKATGAAAKGVNIGGALAEWNRLNPFLQNERVKSTIAKTSTYTKSELAGFIANPGGSEQQLRGASLSASFNQQIYYNILRRSADVPKYKWFLVPEYLDNGEYNKDKFKNECQLVNDWIETFNIPNSLKTIGMQVKREGKASYVLRSSFSGAGKNKKTDYAVLEKLPPDWVKITGIGQLGYTVSFDFGYFLQLGYDPAYFGPFFVACWNDIINHGIITENKKLGVREINPAAAVDYKFMWEGHEYVSMLESKSGIKTSYLFWIQLPYNFAFTFGSDNSHPFVTPDTAGLLQKLQELTDYGTLAGLIASTPLTAVLTGEAEFVDGARPSKNETKISPEVLSGLQDMFNAMTSSNIEAYFLPLKNIKLQQLNADVNSSEIVTKATENLVTQAGEGGLTIVDTKPNVSMVKATELLSEAQQEYVTLQMENVLNYIIQHNLGFGYKWKLKIWGGIFTIESEKKYLKEIVLGGNMALLPKLMSAEDMTMSDTAATVAYIKSLGVYNEFETLTAEKQAEKGLEAQEKSTEDEGSEKSVGRPALDDSEVENDATAASKDEGTNTADNREQLSEKCPVCHENDLEEGQVVCEECAERIEESRE